MRRDPRVPVVVTSTGSPLPRDTAITWKGTCTVHDSREVRDRCSRELAAALSPGHRERLAQFPSFVGSPRRVVFEVEPTQRIGHDGAKIGAATAAWLAARSTS